MYLEQDGKQTKLNQQMEPRSYLPNCALGNKGLLKETGGHMGPGFVSVVLIRISDTNQLKHDRHWTSGEPGASGDVI